MSAHDSERAAITPEQMVEIRKWIIQSILGILAYGAIIFLCAGRLDWVWGWALLAVIATFMAAHPLLLIPRDPDLLVQREKGLREPGVKAWDRVISAFAAGILPLASWVIAALDLRFGWTAIMPLPAHLVGLLINALGYALFLWAMVSNAFFAEGVRVQEERGHTVASTGPYRWVRHPGYVGAILSQAATPFLLGSCWALIPTVCSALLYVLRTALEDRTLQHELPGYSDYAEHTRYRLWPGLW